MSTNVPPLITIRDRLQNLRDIAQRRIIPVDRIPFSTRHLTLSIPMYSSRHPLQVVRAVAVGIGRK